MSTKIALIAGNGNFPLQFIKSAKQQGYEIICIAHRGETSKEIQKLCTKYIWVKIGELAKIISFIKENNVDTATFAGGIRRLNIFRNLKLDAQALNMLSKMRSIKDDILLKQIAKQFEDSGIKIIAPTSLMQNCTLGKSYLSTRKLSESELKDAQVGWQTAKIIGQADVGQTVVVHQGSIVAVEAIEGTDRTIQRAGKLIGAGCVVVKICKPEQDLRFDLPTIGPATIKSLHKIKATALIAEANKTIVLDPDEVRRLADKYKISVGLFEVTDFWV